MNQTTRIRIPREQSVPDGEGPVRHLANEHGRTIMYVAELGRGLSTESPSCEEATDDGELNRTAQLYLDSRPIA